jgi:anthranilate phosphoribosyltransferase
VVARALDRVGVDRALVVHGSGMDEIALHDDTAAAELRDGDIEEYTITPEDLGLDRAPVEEISGGTPTENAADLRDIVTGQLDGPKRDIILANAGAAIYVAGEAESLAAGVEQAREAIDSGAAGETLETLAGGEVSL